MFMIISHVAIRIERSHKVIPEVTRRLIREMAAQKHNRRMSLDHHGAPLLIDVFPGVFLPASPHSSSSSLLRLRLEALTGKMVLDLGCGTGVESIAALLSGARSVDAIDIEDVACRCTTHNAALNGVEDLITVYHGDMFEPVEGKMYDLIIANLPILDHKPEEQSAITAALFDPGFELHHRLLAEGRSYLNPNGSITFTHANLLSSRTGQPYADFVRLETLIFDCDYRISARYIADKLGYRWINYRIQPRRR